jgi:hypothetical protein
MWSLFSSTPKKERLVAVFDIGSGSVGGAIVSLDKEEKESIPRIIASTRLNIESKSYPDTNFEAFAKEMLFTLEQTARDLFNFKKGAPEEIFCMLASPWYDSEIRNIKKSNLKKVGLNKNQIDLLTKEELIKLNREYNEKYKSDKDKRIVIEQYVSSFILDGQTKANPLGKKARNVEMDLVVSVSPKEIIKKIKEEIQKSFSVGKVDFMSFSSASYLAIRDNFVINKDTYFLVDISGQTTDITAIDRGFVKSFKSFSFGRKNIFRYLCNKLGIEAREAKNFFNLHNDNNLTNSLKNKIDPEISFLKTTWFKKFKQKIEEIKEEGVKTSKTFFITADDDVKKWFSKIIEESEKDETLLDPYKGVNIIALDGSEFLRSYYPKNCRFDPFLAIATLALVKEKIEDYGKN